MNKPVINVPEFLSDEEKTSAVRNLFTALTKVKDKLQQPVKNKDGYGYKYATLDSVIAAITAACQGLDIGFTQYPVSEDGKAGVGTMVMCSLGASIDFGAVLIPVDKGRSTAQEYGKVLTYARRYSISAVFGIASEEDTDGASVSYSRSNNKPVRPNAKPTPDPDKIAKEYTVETSKGHEKIVDLIDSGIAGDDEAKKIVQNLTGKDKNVYNYIVEHKLWNKK